MFCPPAWFGNPGNENNPKWTNANWLKSRFHFSFAEYNNPKNSNFGVLRVMNDDLVQPSRGFGTHGHREMEICTYVVNGELTHKDSMGTQESLGKGSIQFMTAGELPFKRLCCVAVLAHVLLRIYAHVRQQRRMLTTQGNVCALAPFIFDSMVERR